MIPGSQTFTLNPTFGPFDYDYSLPDDGRLYEWDFAFTSADPNATVNLEEPNQIDEFLTYNTSSGMTSGLAGSIHDIGWTETQTPGLTSILYQAPMAYNYCAIWPVQDNRACAASFNVWGNGIWLEATGTALITVTTSFRAVPEPAAWALLLVGFGGLGVALRRRRSTEGQALAA